MQTAAKPAATGVTAAGVAVAPAAAAQTTPAALGRVLLVGDADGDFSAPKHHLEKAGFTACECAGGIRARVLFREMRPQAIVISTNLRGVSHTELARMLLDADPDLGVIFAGTTPATLADRAAALSIGACDHLDLRLESELLFGRLTQIVNARERLERLRAAADCDYLTGLANRRRFRAALGQEVERYRRYKIPCALLMIDIDHLKRINDLHGHPAGDEAIRCVAANLADMSRDNDTAARLGGEEFALLLANADSRHALIVAERVRSTIAQTHVDPVGTITVSVGVAACPTHAAAERTLYAAADAALYHAKNSGRDRVELA